MALISFVLTHWRGIAMNPDGWAEWQGALSLVTGHGYTYFSGNPIIAWPPLYSIYLAIWTVILGPTGLALVVSQAVLVVLQAFLWTWLFQRVARDGGLAVSAGAALLLSAFLGLFVCQFQPSILSHNLLYTVLPLLLWSLWRLESQATPREETAALVLGIASGSLLLLAHNAAIGFVAAAATIVATRRPLSARSVIAAACLVAIPLLIWQATRHALGQTGSHHIGWAAGRFSLADYGAQIFEGVGLLVLPARLHAGFSVLPLLVSAAVALCVTGARRSLRFGLVFVGYSMLFTLALFNVTFVMNELSHPRYVAFIPLILVPLVFLSADVVAPRIAKASLLLLLAVQVYWTGRAAHFLVIRSLPELGFLTDPEESLFVMPDVYIDRAYRSGPPVATSKGLLVAPMSFEEPPGRRQ